MEKIKIYLVIWFNGRECNTFTLSAFSQTVKQMMLLDRLPNILDTICISEKDFPLFKNMPGYNKVDGITTIKADNIRIQMNENVFQVKQKLYDFNNTLYDAVITYNLSPMEFMIKHNVESKDWELIKDEENE